MTYQSAPRTAPYLGDTAWPQVLFEEHSQGRDQYSAAVVPEIAGLDPRLDCRVQALAEKATMDMVRFDVELGEGTSVAPLLIRSESVSSSRIANITASASEIELAEQGDTSNPAASLVEANIRALQFAAEVHKSSFGLALKSIAVIHYELFKDSDPDAAGAYRTAPGRIEGAPRRDARYEPPHRDRVFSAVTDLLDFMRRDDLPVLIQAAVAHAQFAAIHPFTDGNGRVGRAVVSSLLRVKRITRNVTVPLSSGLLARGTGTYFDALGEYREGNVQPIVELFAESSLHATHIARQIVEGCRE